MTKKKSILSVSDDLSGLFSKNPTPRTTVKSDRMTVKKAHETITRQMEISGNRPRTISDYSIQVKHFAETTKLIYLDELKAESIYEWLSRMNVSNQTKLTRLKCLKAFLSRCFSNGWIETQFWKSITIRVDSKVKEGATEREIRTLLSLLDLGDFVQLRDATAALLMFKTGIRVNTIVHLENRHIDFTEKLLRLDGAIMKNHDQLLLPFDDTLHRLLYVLVRQNDAIRHAYGVENNYVFITKQGGVISNSPTHNNIQKRLNKYSKEFGLRNINPHALRRGFAKSLLNKGANIAEISKALGHSNLAVTTQYLHLDKEEVAENLRKYL
ncbi:integrase [Bacillus sp. AFS076308]|uniref:tyrosine-type recombinase/integrase n=1 Tax=unclassified Bacillus (in: firmicutes) TaxID=185979 RepID=UPI000BF5F11B|nr:MULTISPECIES: site-specific integrase [unclassified Bacillus (in: firmicutes)]PFO10229.1 integrase [Bacillus sp. AFS076308]PGV48570.1 integrase [Bacillus sp. AFS037270]